MRRHHLNLKSSVLLINEYLFHYVRLMVMHRICIASTKISAFWLKNITNCHLSKWETRSLLLHFIVYFRYLPKLDATQNFLLTIRAMCNPYLLQYKTEELLDIFDNTLCNIYLFIITFLSFSTYFSSVFCMKDRQHSSRHRIETSFWNERLQLVIPEFILLSTINNVQMRDYVWELLIWVSNLYIIGIVSYT